MRGKFQRGFVFFALVLAITVHGRDGGGINESFSRAEVLFSAVFDGVDGVVTAPTNIAYDKKEGEGYTVECWFKTSATTEGTLVARIDEVADRGFRLFLEADGQIAYRTETTNNQAEKVGIGSNLNDDAWHHVAMVISSVDTTSSSTTIYIDGVSSNVYVHEYHYYGFSNTMPLTVGYTFTNGYFNGSIKNVRVWQVARTSGDINADMNNDVPTSNVTNLVANFIMNDGSGTVAADSSTIANNAALTGGASFVGETAPTPVLLPALLLNGNANITAPHHADLNFNNDTGTTGNQSFAVMSWVKAIDGATSGTLFDKANGTSNQAGYWAKLIDGGFVEIQFKGWSGNESPNVTSLSSINDGDWHHVALVVNEDVLNLYIDGVLDVTNLNGGYNDGVNNTVPLILGNNQGLTDPFTGALKDFRIYQHTAGVDDPSVITTFDVISIMGNPSGSYLINNMDALVRYEFNDNLQSSGTLGAALNGTASTTISYEETFSYPILPPEGLSLVARSDLSFEIRWDAVTVADGYMVEVATDAGFSSYVTGYPKDNVIDTQEEVTGLVAGTKYYYSVKTKIGDSYSISASQSISTFTNPGGVLHHWNLDENSGTTAGDSVGGADGTLDATTSWDTEGLDGSAGLFTVDDGGINFGITPAIIGTGDFTWSAWFKTSVTDTAGHMIIAQRSDWDGAATLEYVNGEIKFWQYRGGEVFTKTDLNTFQPGAIINDGNWHNVVAVRETDTNIAGNSFLKIYVDGAIANDASVSQLSKGLLGFVVGVGKEYRDNGRQFVGSIDEIKIYEYALSDQTVIDLYDAFNVSVIVSVDSTTLSTIELSWLGANAETYLVDIATDSEFTTFVDGYERKSTINRFETVTGLQPGIDYYVRVAPVMSGVEKGPSSTVIGTTLIYDLSNPKLNGSAVNFPASIDGITVTNPDFSNGLNGSGACTLAFWSYMDSSNYVVNSSSISLSSGGQRQISVKLPQGGIIYWDVADNIATPGEDYQRVIQVFDPEKMTNKWVFWTFTYDANTEKSAIYLDGNLMAQNTFDSDWNTIATIDTFEIASSWNGSMDELTLWNKALNGGEISALMHSKVDPGARRSLSNLNLMAYYSFDEAAGTIASDGVGSNNGTFGGATTWLDSGAVILVSADNMNVLSSNDDSFDDGIGLEISATANFEFGDGVSFGTYTSGNSFTIDNAPDRRIVLDGDWFVSTANSNGNNTSTFTFKLSDFDPTEMLKVKHGGTYELAFAISNSDIASYSSVQTATSYDTINETVTFVDVPLVTGFYTLASNIVLTPAMGLEFHQERKLISWSVSDEAGVKEYQIVDVVTGESIDTVQAGLGSYIYQLSTDRLVKLVIVDESGFTQTFVPEDGNMISVVYDLIEGWNLIALPGDDADVSELLAASTGFFWGWDGSSYETVTESKACQGVWINVPAARQVVVTATKSDAEMTIEAGWNLVGPKENVEVPEAADVVYGWNSTYEEVLTDSGVLIQGIGYWIFSTN